MLRIIYAQFRDNSADLLFKVIVLTVKYLYTGIDSKAGVPRVVFLYYGSTPPVSLHILVRAYVGVRIILRGPLRVP
jgi:hypothetical protein